MLMKPPTANHTYGAKKPDSRGLIDVADCDVKALEKTGWVKTFPTKQSKKQPKRIALTDTPKDTE